MLVHRAFWQYVVDNALHPASESFARNVLAGNVENRKRNMWLSTRSGHKHRRMWEALGAVERVSRMAETVDEAYTWIDILGIRDGRRPDVPVLAWIDGRDPEGGANPVQEAPVGD